MPVNGAMTLNSVIQKIQQATASSYEVFVGGQRVDLKSKIHSVIKNGSKILLYGEQKVGLPEGLRWFSRFPKHIIEGDGYGVGTSEQSICFVPMLADVEIYGFGFYRHSS